ncbi:MAG: hypothetical protein PHF00_00515 [Elusimicrobia bacterium]|nr:hypothetical protein [Elusimicrobiota bacterium]
MLLHAELLIESVAWQTAAPARGRKPVYADADAVTAAAPRLRELVRVLVRLKNRGPKAVDGVLLRYAISAELAPLDGAREGAWAVPYMVDARRVPKIGPNKILDVPVDPSRSLEVPLAAYLQRVYRSGFWPRRLRVQVMLSPHRGQVDEIRTHESVLEVSQ